jgi:ligand-binding sensor domain-containing protein
MTNRRLLALPTALLAILFLLSAPPAHSNQDTAPPTLLWDVLAPAGQIRDLAHHGQESWLATTTGVARINRQTGVYTLYNTSTGLPDDYVWSAAVDNQGHAWFGTMDGYIMRFNGTSWSYYTGPGISGYPVYPITVAPDGRMLFGVGSGVLAYDGTSFQGVPPGGPMSRVTAIAVDGSQRIWVGTRENGTYQLDGSTWTHYGDPTNGPGGRVNDIAIAANGDAWFAFSYAHDGAVGRMSVGGGWTRFGTGDGLINDSALALAFDNSGQLWASFDAAMTGGVARFNGAAWSEVNIFQATGIWPYLGVNNAELDGSGQMWLTSGNLLFRLSGAPRVLSAGLPLNLGQLVYAVEAAPNGDLWLGISRLGAARYNGQAWRLFTRADGLNGDLVQDIVVAGNGHVWLATWREEWAQLGYGVSRYNGQSFTSYMPEDGLVSNAINALATDGSGAVWAVASAGLSRFHNGSWTSYPSGPTSGLVGAVQAVAGYGDVVYAGDLAGLARLEGDMWQRVSLSPLPSSGPVRAITFDNDGHPWLARDAALAYHDGQGWNAQAYPGNLQYGGVMIAFDASGALWLATSSGSGAPGLNRQADNVWTSYNQSNSPVLGDGFEDIAVNGNTVWFSQYESGIGRLRQLYGLDRRAYLPLIP